MRSFTPKPWQNEPDHSTALSATALIDLETRLSGYTDQAVPVASSAGLVGLSDGNGNVVWTSASSAAGTLGYEQTANKGAASGYAGLGGDSRVPIAQLPVAELGRLAAQKTKLENNAAITGPATNGASVTLHTLTGAGVVRDFWITCDAATAKDVRLQITADGAGSPDVDIDLGTLFLWHDSFLNWFEVSTLHWHGEMGNANQMSGSFRFPIPYSNGATIKLVGTAAHGTWHVWSQCSYQPLANAAATPSLRLKSQGVRHANAVTVAQANSYTFFDITPALGGWLVWLALLEKPSPAALNLTFLERNIQATVDGGVDIVSSATEDLIHGAFYYDADTGYDTPWSVLAESAHAPAYVYNQAIDLLALCGGWKFNSELKLDLLTEAAVTTDHSMCWLALYYQAV